MELIVRPVRTADWPAVRRISSRIWEGRDYVPLFFGEWVREGGFWAGELRGRVVGYGKATELAPGEWWLEGLRVDPQRRHRGIGTELSRQILYRTFDERPVSLRLATGAVNRESIRIIEETMGFRFYVQYSFIAGTPAEAEETPRPKLAVPSLREAQEFMQTREELKASRGLLQSSWRFRAANARYLRDLRRQGSLYGCREAGRLTGLLVMTRHRYRRTDLDISFVGGTRPALSAFGSYIRSVARELDTKTVSGMAASDEMTAAVRALGVMARPRVSAVFVYDYPV
jgi:GNAT superfamily N-acetyltransferase